MSKIVKNAKIDQFWTLSVSQSVSTFSQNWLISFLTPGLPEKGPMNSLPCVCLSVRVSVRARRKFSELAHDFLLKFCMMVGIHKG